MLIKFVSLSSPPLQDSWSQLEHRWPWGWLGGRQLLGKPGGSCPGLWRCPRFACLLPEHRRPSPALVQQHVKSPRITGWSRSCKRGLLTPRLVNPSFLLLWEAGEGLAATFLAAPAEPSAAGAARSPLSAGSEGTTSRARRWAQLGHSPLPCSVQRWGVLRAPGGKQRCHPPAPLRAGRRAARCPDGEGAALLPFSSLAFSSLPFPSFPSLPLPSLPCPLRSPPGPFPARCAALRSRRGGRGRGRAEAGLAAARRAAHTRTHTSLHVIKWLEICF